MDDLAEKKLTEASDEVVDLIFQEANKKNGVCHCFK